MPVFPDNFHLLDLPAIFHFNPLCRAAKEFVNPPLSAAPFNAWGVIVLTVPHYSFHSYGLLVNF